MKLEQSFDVQAPLQRVWEALIDVERVAPCLPGAAITGSNPDGSYNGEFKVKIGPTSAAYSGKLQMENVDETTHSATMQAAGTDKRGQGGAKATITSSVAEAGAGATTVHVSTDYHITGRLARFGRGGMIEEISNRLLGEFAKSLQAMLGEGGTEESPAVAAGPSDDVIAAQSAPTEIDVPAPVETPEPVEAAAPADAPEPVDAPAPAGNGGAPEPAETPEPATNEEPVAPAPMEPPTGTAVPPSQPTISASAGASSNGGQSSQESEPLNGLSLMGKVLLSQAKRNPAPVAAAVIGFVVVLRVLRRRR